jgi:predicted metal-dependent phosphoesterase TrpH
VTVLAHPAHGVPPDRLTALVRAAAAAGVRGCEVASSWHDSSQRRRTAELAAEAGLVPTAGSDWHGAVKPAVPDPVIDPDPVRFADMLRRLDLA